MGGCGRTRERERAKERAQIVPANRAALVAMSFSSVRKWCVGGASRKFTCQRASAPASGVQIPRSLASDLVCRYPYGRIAPGSCALNVCSVFFLRLRLRQFNTICYFDCSAILDDSCEILKSEAPFPAHSLWLLYLLLLLLLLKGTGRCGSQTTISF